MKAQQQSAFDYRVTVNDKYGSRPANKARIQTSIENPKCDGVKFHALVQWCSARFPEIEVIVSDTLYRHNLSFDTPTAWNMAREEGDKWIRRNAEALKGLKVTRWDSLLHHDNYVSSYEHIEEALDKDKNAHGIFLDMARNFSARKNIAVEKCADFLKEELAVFYFMMREPAVDIYTGSWMFKLFEALPLPVFKDLQCLEVDFERRRLP